MKQAVEGGIGRLHTEIVREHEERIPNCLDNVFRRILGRAEGLLAVLLRGKRRFQSATRCRKAATSWWNGRDGGVPSSIGWCSCLGQAVLPRSGAATTRRHVWDQQQRRRSSRVRGQAGERHRYPYHIILLIVRYI